MASVIQYSSSLQELLQKAEQLSKLNHIVQKVLDPKLRGQVKVANLREGVLILSCSSPVWGHTLRFSIDKILSAIRMLPLDQTMGQVIKRIETQVTPD